jgi:hypothetical protein
MSFVRGRSAILDLGMTYYADHPDEVEKIRCNLRLAGLSDSARDLEATLSHIVIHYYEKLFSLVKRYEALWICQNRIQIPADMRSPFEEAIRDHKAIFMAQSHFGATYLLASVLMAQGIDLHMVGKFPEPVGSLLVQNSTFMTERYGTGSVSIINLADPSVDVPMEMFRALMTGKTISNVFDENNEFSREISFRGRTIRGGSGMDLILRNFDDERVILLTPFLIRTGEDTFRYEQDRHFFRDGDIINSFYESLERRVEAYPAQWYFVHEFDGSFVDRRSV